MRPKMNEFSCAPVLLTVFNRPHETRQVLERLKIVRPEKIYVAADGPREGRSEDQSLCEDVRKLIAEEIDWSANVMTDYAQRNLGLRQRIASAITWTLENEDSVIVLEDDCVPDTSFFRYCTELLEKYEREPRVGVVTGDNFQPEGFNCGASYYFSRYPHCWGWATWRRAWGLNDQAMSDWPRVRSTDWLSSIFPEPLEALYWQQLFDDTYSGKIDTWDYQWTYACWRHNMLTVTPRTNLVRNVGIGEAATNTRDAEPEKHHRKCLAMEFPLLHPFWLERNKEADDYAQQTVFGRAKNSSVYGRLRRLMVKAAKLAHRIFKISNG